MNHICTSALIACLLIFVGVSLVELMPGNKSIGYALQYIGIPLYLIMKRCFEIVTLCFALDQLMDAPSSEISAFIHWKYFISILTWLIDRVLTCTLERFWWNNFVYLALHILSLAVILTTI